MKAFPRAVWLTIIVSSLTMSTGSMMVLISGLIGAELAPDASMATLPLALMIAGTALSMIPMGHATHRWGRKLVMVNGALIAVVGSLAVAMAIIWQSFAWLCGAALIIGASMAVVQQYRFAVMEWVAPELRGDASSKVLLGGLVSAFIGPELATLGQHWFTQPYLGSFLMLAGVNLVAALMLTQLPSTPANARLIETHQAPRSKTVLTPALVTAVLAGAIGYAVMSFIMTATPLHMHGHHGHSLESTKWVIQSHILAMFAPSLVSGWLIRRLGLKNMMLSGVAVYAICIAVALNGTSVDYFWWSLILLGIGWNFLFVGGTTLLGSHCPAVITPKVQAYNDFTIFSSQALASLSAGWVLHALGWQAQLWLCVPLLIIMLLALSRWQPGHTALASAPSQS